MTEKVSKEIINILYQQLVEWFEDKASIFAENETFEEFYQYILDEYPEDFLPLKDLNESDLVDLKVDSIIIIAGNNYNNLKAIFEKFLALDSLETFEKELNNFINFTEKIKKYNFKCLNCLKQILKGKPKKCYCNNFPIQNKEDLKKFLNKSILLSYESIFHLMQRLNFFKEVNNQEEVNKLFPKLKTIRDIKSSKLIYGNEAINELDFDSIERVLKAKKLSFKGFTQNQVNFLEFYIQQQLVFIHGYPGSSKTFTGMLAIILDSLLKLRKEKQINWLILAPTYEALKAAAENLYSFLEYLIEASIIPKDLKVNLILPLSKTNPRTDDILKDLFYQNLENWDYSDARQYIAGNFRILKLSRKAFNIEKKKNSIFKSNDKTLNIILDLPIAFIRYGRGQPKDIKDIEFHGLHIEEASQFSILDLLMVLIANKGKFLDSLIEELKDKSSNSNKLRKFSFSGDPYQLPSIFQIKDKIVKSKHVGPLFNLFSFFLKDLDPADNKNIFVLKETYRCPPKIIEPIKGILYPDIVSRSTNSQGKILLKEYKGEEIKYKKDNKEEVELIKQFLKNELENYLETKSAKKICILTPYRKQERLLKSGLSSVLEKLKEKNIIKDFTIGTVDKVQGATCDIVILSLTSTDEKFIEANYTFLLEPSRLNVALTRTRELFVLFFHKNIYRLLSLYDTEYQHALKMLLHKYKTTFFEHKKLENFERIFKSWNPNIGSVILERMILYGEKTEK